MPLVTNATPEPIKLPQWDIFQLGMLQNPAYQRVSDRSANRLAVNRLETFFSQHADNWEVAAGLWYQMLAGCIVEVRPTETEVTGWCDWVVGACASAGEGKEESC